MGSVGFGAAVRWVVRFRSGWRDEEVHSGVGPRGGRPPPIEASSAEGSPPRGQSPCLTYPSRGQSPCCVHPSRTLTPCFDPLLPCRPTWQGARQSESLIASLCCAIAYSFPSAYGHLTVAEDFARNLAICDRSSLDTSDGFNADARRTKGSANTSVAFVRVRCAAVLALFAVAISSALPAGTGRRPWSPASRWGRRDRA